MLWLTYLFFCHKSSRNSNIRLENASKSAERNESHKVSEVPVNVAGRWEKNQMAASENLAYSRAATTHHSLHLRQTNG